MTIEQHIGLIKRAFGSASIISSFKHGYAFYSYLVNNQWVVRIPRDNSKLDKRRAEFLSEFSEISQIEVPIIKFYRDDVSGIEYETSQYIKGVSFDPSIANKFTQTNLKVIASQLGEFFTSLHSFSLERARELGLEEMKDVRGYADYLIENEKALPLYKNTVFPLLTINEQEWVLNMFSSYAEQVRINPFATKLIHSDMWTYHIIVDPKKERLMGIIDFSLRIADPARDFKPFEYYGKEFIDKAYEKYLSVDDAFDQRRFFYTILDEVFEINRSLEEKDKEKLSKRLGSLQSLISKYPHRKFD